MADAWKLYRILDDNNERQSIPDSGLEGLTYSPEENRVEGAGGPLEVTSAVQVDKDGRRVAAIRTKEHEGLRLCFESGPALTAADFERAVLGTWQCTFVDQEQSEEEEDEYGEYDDYGESRRQQASETEFAGATIEFFEDKRYKLVANDYSNSHGTWSINDNSLKLQEADDCINGYEGFVWTAFNGRDGLNLGWKLNDDAHDGLDTLILEFGRPS